MRPPRPTFTNVTHNRATGNWIEPDDNGADITSYDLQFRQGTTGSYTTISGQTGLTYSLSGLMPSTIYQLRVRATNSEGRFGLVGQRAVHDAGAAHGASPGWQRSSGFCRRLLNQRVTHYAAAGAHRRSG